MDVKEGVCVCFFGVGEGDIRKTTQSTNWISILSEQDKSVCCTHTWCIGMVYIHVSITHMKTV